MRGASPIRGCAARTHLRICAAFAQAFPQAFPQGGRDVVRRLIGDRFRRTSTVGVTDAPRALALFPLLSPAEQSAAVRRLRHLAWPVDDIVHMTGLPAERVRQMLEEVSHADPRD